MILPALTEATSPFFRPIKYSLFPPLGLATLAGYADLDDTVSIHDEHVQRLSLGDHPDLVVIQVYITSARRSYAIADHYRRTGVHVALGGLHVTSLPDEAAMHADTILLGPGEDTFPQFLHDLRTGAPQRRYTSQLRTLTGVPAIRRDLIQRHRYLVPNSIVVSRGCPHVCDFCYKAAFFKGGRQFYTQQVDDALAEIDRLPGRHLYFLDDHLFGNPRFASSLFDSDNLSEQSKYQNIGRDYAAAVQRLHAFGVMVNASFVFGMDHDGPDVFDRTVHSDWDLYDTRHVVFRPARLDPTQLEAGYWRAYRDFYRWGSILRGASTQQSLRKRLRHIGYAAGWKKFEPLWDVAIRTGQVLHLYRCWRVFSADLASTLQIAVVHQSVELFGCLVRLIPLHRPQYLARRTGCILLRQVQRQWHHVLRLEPSRRHRRLPQTCTNERPLCFLFVGAGAARVARQQHVHGDVGVLQFVREVQGHRDHPRLGRLVGHLATLRPPAGVAVRRDTHDAAAALRKHRLHETLDHAQRAEDVRLEHRLPVAHLRFQGGDTAMRWVQIALPQTGVVDHHVDRAEALHRRRVHALDV
jgi:hypothetical protein